MTTSQIQIQRTLTSDQRHAAAGILYAAFERKLRPMLGSKRAVSYIETALVPERCIVAIEQHEVVGIIGLQYDGKPSQQASLRTSVSRLGLFRGLLAVVMQEGTHRRPDEKELYIEALAVKVDQRGRGIGTRLLQEALALGSELGKERITLEVIDTNPDAYRLYVRLGFSCIRTRRYPFTQQMMGFRSVGLMQREL